MRNTDEYIRFSKVIAEHHGLPMDDDPLAAATIKDLLLDLGYDPIWARRILQSTLKMINDEFGRTDPTLPDHESFEDKSI